MAASGWPFLQIATGAVLLLAGCAAPQLPQLPFQAMSSGSDLSFGYKDVRSDPRHYTVVYADNREAAAKANLQLRAAQIAKDAGFPYFIFERQGVNLVKRVENELQPRERPRTIRGQVVPNDYVPETRLVGITLYYFAWGQVALLTETEGKASADALRAADMLAQASPRFAP